MSAVPPLSSSSSSASSVSVGGPSLSAPLLSSSMSSVASSTTGGASTPRSQLSRLNSQTSSTLLASDPNSTFHGFKTVSLPGLFPGTHLGILASSVLDKRRDGAVRGGWARRLFLISTRGIHYYRKSEEYELFGKERGQVFLKDIGFAKLIPPEKAPSGAVEPNVDSNFFAILSKRKSLLMFLRADSLELATQWVNVINRALQISKSLNFSIKWQPEIYQNFITSAASNFREQTPPHVSPKGEIFEEEAVMERSAPHVLVITVLSTDTSPSSSSGSLLGSPQSGDKDFERVIDRATPVRKEIMLGVLQSKDTIFVLLSDGEEVAIRVEDIGVETSALVSKEKEIICASIPKAKDMLSPHLLTSTKLTVSFRTGRLPRKKSSLSSSGFAAASPTNASTIMTSPTAAGVPGSNNSSCGSTSASMSLFPCGLSSLFLLSCVVSFWLAQPFEGLMKVTIILGFCLSVSQTAQFCMCTYLSIQEKRLALSSSTAGAPKLKRRSSARKRHDDEFVLFMNIKKIEVVVVEDSTSDVGNELDKRASFRLRRQASDTMTISEKDATDDETKSSASTRDDPAVSTSSGVPEELIKSGICGGPIPFSHRFIAAEKGDEVKGEQRYRNTLEWRKENDMDYILVRPHPHFDTIKKYYPQFFHGRSKTGLPVYYEQPGKIDLNALKCEGLSMEDLLYHYKYITEYLYRVIEPRDDGRTITVLDVSGIGMSDLGGEVLDFIKRASAFTGAHYPERSAHIFIINIPGWFSMVWRMVKPLIDPVTREKIHMLKGSAILKELETLIDSNQIPSDLGGTGCAFGESIEEREMKIHVDKFNASPILKESSQNGQ